MRFTISLEDDLYRVAKSMAKAEDSSISASINKLIRRGLETGQATIPASKKGKKISSFPVSHKCRPFSDEDVYQLEVAEDKEKWNAS